MSLLKSKSSLVYVDKALDSSLVRAMSTVGVPVLSVDEVIGL